MFVVLSWVNVSEELDEVENKYRIFLLETDGDNQYVLIFILFPINFNEMIKNIAFHSFYHFILRFLLMRLHGVIGLQPFDNVTFTSLVDEDAMDYFVEDDIESGYHRMSIKYANADQYVHGRPDSELSIPVQDLLK